MTTTITISLILFLLGSLIFSVFKTRPEEVEDDEEKDSLRKQ